MNDRGQGGGRGGGSKSASSSSSSSAASAVGDGGELPRFRYCFYLDILSSELDEGVQNALHHLREQSDYCRVLGSYPANSRLVGPVAEAVEALNAENEGKTHEAELRLKSLPSDDDDTRRLNIGFVGYGAFGQYLSKQMASHHNVRCIDPVDKVSSPVKLCVRKIRMTSSAKPCDFRDLYSLKRIVKASGGEQCRILPYI